MRILAEQRAALNAGGGFGLPAAMPGNPGAGPLGDPSPGAMPAELLPPGFLPANIRPAAPQPDAAPARAAPRLLQPAPALAMASTAPISSGRKVVRVPD